MSSSSEELLFLISETRKQLKHLEQLGVEAVVQTAPNESARSKAKQAANEPKEQVLGSKPVRPAIEPSARVATPTPSVNLFGDLGSPGETLPASTESFEQIHQEIGECVRCPLHQQRTHVCHTEGNRKARLMFVGEAPGADEDAQARPFVGKAGQLLTKIIEAIGLKREEVLIGNVNRCRPPGNRPPTPEEASLCKPYLLREIAIAQPEVIVVLGNTALHNLLETREGITKLRGKFRDYKGIKVMPTFHPAYLLRDPSKKRETWEDLKMVRDYLDSNRPTTS